MMRYCCKEEVDLVISLQGTAASTLSGNCSWCECTFKESVKETGNEPSLASQLQRVQQLHFHLSTSF
jgi:hypothetical protein